MDANRPAFSLRTLTNVELREYRRELEHSLKVISPAAPVRGLLTSKLLEVLSEQASRSSPTPEPEEEDEEVVSNS